MQLPCQLLAINISMAWDAREVQMHRPGARRLPGCITDVQIKPHDRRFP